jgi:hypothetical protein
MADHEPLLIPDAPLEQMDRDAAKGPAGTPLDSKIIGPIMDDIARRALVDGPKLNRDLIGLGSGLLTNGKSKKAE